MLEMSTFSIKHNQSVFSVVLIRLVVVTEAPLYDFTFQYKYFMSYLAPFVSQVQAD